jgi:hypothetical protein
MGIYFDSNFKLDFVCVLGITMVVCAVNACNHTYFSCRIKRIKIKFDAFCLVIREGKRFNYCLVSPSYRKRDSLHFKLHEAHHDFVNYT